MATDPHWGNVSILCPFTTDYDSVAGIDAGIYANYASIVESPSRFGAGSMAVDGATDYWRASNTLILPSGTDDFTIEGHTRIDSWYNSINTVVNLYQSSMQGLRFSVLSDGTARLELLDDFFALINPTTISLDTWFHWAITRESGAFNLWINGVGSTSRASSLSLAPTYLYLGVPGWNTSADEVDGWYNDLRVTRWLARYTADFTPPDAPFPPYDTLFAGVVVDETGAPCARTLRCYYRTTGTLLASTTSDATTGAYQFGVSSGVEYQIVALDSGATRQDLIARVNT